MYDVLESDWKLYKKKLPEWQKRYISKLISEYQEILNGDSAPSETFWALDERMKQDKKCPGVIVYRYSRSTMTEEIGQMAHDRVITLADLDGFSDDVIEFAKFCHIQTGDWDSL